MRSDDRGSISYQLTLLKDLLRGGAERLFFREGSVLPQQLAQLPAVTHRLNDTEHPVLAACGYCIAGLVAYETVERFGAGATKKSITDNDPWRRLKNF